MFLLFLPTHCKHVNNINRVSFVVRFICTYVSVFVSRFLSVSPTVSFTQIHLKSQPTMIVMNSMVFVYSCDELFSSIRDFALIHKTYKIFICMSFTHASSRYSFPHSLSLVSVGFLDIIYGMQSEKLCFLSVNLVNYSCNL